MTAVPAAQAGQSGVGPKTTGAKKAARTGKAAGAKKATRRKAAGTKKSTAKTPTSRDAQPTRHARTSATRNPPRDPDAAQGRPDATSATGPVGAEPGAEAHHEAPQIPRSWPNAPVRRGLGVALLGLAGAGRFTAGAAPVTGPGAELPAEPVMDVALGAVDLALEAAERVSTAVRDYVNPLLVRAWGPAGDTMGGVAGAGLRALAGASEPLAARGRRLRSDAEHEAAEAVAAVLPETIQLVMEQLDLTGMAIDHVDLKRVLEATAEQVDLTGFAIEHMDLERLIEASVDSMDFTGLAISRLDFARAVTAAMEQVDIYTVAREQMDPARVAQYLRENVDVAEALRSAPTAVAGEAVRGVRDTVGRITGRR